jgi:hypothetical protein
MFSFDIVTTVVNDAIYVCICSAVQCMRDLLD